MVSVASARVEKIELLMIKILQSRATQEAHSTQSVHRTGRQYATLPNLPRFLACAWEAPSTYVSSMARSQADADTVVKEVERMCYRLLNVRVSRLEFRLLLSWHQADIRADAVERSLANASAEAIKKLSYILGRHELRFLLRVQLPAERVYNLLRCVCQNSKLFTEVDSARAVLLRARALVCTHARWIGSEQLLNRAITLEPAETKHAQRMSTIMNALNKHSEGYSHLREICDEIDALDQEFSRDDAAAVTETLVAAALAAVSLDRTISRSSSRRRCSNSSQADMESAEAMLSIDVSATLEQAEEKVKMSLGDKHPLMRLCKACRELAASMRLRGGCVQDHARTCFKFFWTKAHKDAVRNIHQQVGMEPHPDRALATFCTCIDLDNGLDGEKKPI